MGVLRNAYMLWKSLRLPWRSEVFRGWDLERNMYFERYVRSSSRTRRRVVYSKHLTVSEYRDDIIPVQWQAWMRHTREQPPTVQELIQDVQRRKRLAENVRKLVALEQEQEQEQEQKGKEQAHAVQEGPHSPKRVSPERFQKVTPGEQYQPEEWTPSSLPSSSSSSSATQASAAGRYKKD
ncbi:hypothetical protein LPJ64_002237 [Coemansia asiatica]|uniref:NADH dehydrogenase [ubiquinone] 1 alpha subcomplex subunit n=1 Tax=Coemansia asiatica TaxID=1052880 RepID=A0A9W7XM02_9FUNG|nr:hypothetical protein LPJ64_002237 [Coemansia asiatica]